MLIYCLITSLSLSYLLPYLSNMDYDLYLENSNTTISLSSNSYQITEYGRDIIGKHQYSTLNDKICMCTSSTNISYLDEVSFRTLEFYEDNNSSLKGFNPQDIPCILIDKIQQIIYIISDSVGSSPIWYGISGQSNRKDIVITTDLLAASHLNFKRLTSVLPHTVVGINSTSLDIISIYTQKVNSFTEPNKDFASNLLNASITSVSLSSLKHISHIDKSASTNYTFVHEIDYSSDSSVLLDCSITLFQSKSAQDLLDGESYFNKHVRHIAYMAPPLVLSELAYSDIFILPFIRDLIISLDTTQPKPIGYSPSRLKIALNRAHFCYQIVRDSDGSRPVLLSHDSGIGEGRPIEIFFQNLFCSLLGVDTSFSFAHSSVPNSLRSIHPHTRDSIFRSIIDNYIAIGVCANRNKYFEELLNYSGGRTKIFHHNPSISINNMQISKMAISKPSFTQKLYTIASIHSSYSLERYSNEIFVILATSGYSDLLINFICHIKSLSEFSANDNNVFPFLVLSPNIDIINIAKRNRFGGLLIDFDNDKELMSSHFSIGNKVIFGNISKTSFGTILYQELIYFRTITALYLLRQGFSPIVIDIDTVWLSNPLLQITYVDHDLYVVPDSPTELCGCFVYLNYSQNTINFWRHVVDRHHQLLMKNEMQLNISDNMHDMVDSEQVIISELLLRKTYEKDYANLRCIMLPSTYFPSGSDFFGNSTLVDSVISASNSSAHNISIIHNNFVIGSTLKLYRFKQYGLWQTIMDYDYPPYSNAPRDPNPNLVNWMCIKPNQRVQQNWETKYCDICYKNHSITTLLVALPVHNSIIRDGRLKVMLMFENMHHNSDLYRGKIYLKRHPPSYIPFHKFILLDLNISSVQNGMQSVIITLDNSEISLFVDYLVDHLTGNEHHDRLADSDAIDRNSASKFYDLAHENVIKFSSGISHHTVNSSVYITENYDGNQEYLHLENTSKTHRQNCAWWKGEFAEHRGVPEERVHSNYFSTILTGKSSLIDMQFTIRVMAFNRPHSLRRLLLSLTSMRFGSHRVTIMFYIDMCKDTSDFDCIRLNNEVKNIANDFEWNFGEKKVIALAVHRGLKMQWMNIFIPSHSGDISLILEDDMELSPLAFAWGISAINTYYTPEQRSIHNDLLTAVRLHIKNNGSLCEDNMTHLEHFTKRYAGAPLIYGICLQKQLLDPLHFPMSLDIRNGNRPYLHSLIGSWGPILFPIFWEAFREWWIWKSSTNEVPYTADLITNYFFDRNSDIWTPWFIRFVYEIGGKCLYVNLPSNLALASNHRERGANYDITLGSNTNTLQFSDLDDSYRYIKPMYYFDNSSGNSIWNLPSYQELSNYQYDFATRRIGRAGSTDSVHPFQSEGNQGYSQFGSAYQNFIKTIMPSKNIDSISREHYMFIADMIESYVKPVSQWMHIEPNLLPEYLTKPNHYHHDFYSSIFCEWMAAQSLINGENMNCFSDDSLSNALPHTNYDIVVIHTSIIEYSNIDSKSALKLMLSSSDTSVKYIAVVGGACSSAPSELYFNFQNMDTIWFTLVEDMCRESTSNDSGAILYIKRSLLSRGWIDNRFIVAKTLSSDIIHRRVMMTNDLSAV